MAADCCRPRTPCPRCCTAAATRPLPHGYAACSGCATSLLPPAASSRSAAIPTRLKPAQEETKQEHQSRPWQLRIFAQTQNTRHVTGAQAHTAQSVAPVTQHNQITRRTTVAPLPSTAALTSGVRLDAAARVTLRVSSITWGEGWAGGGLSARVLLLQAHRSHAAHAAQTATAAPLTPCCAARARCRLPGRRRGCGRPIAAAPLAAGEAQ